MERLIMNSLINWKEKSSRKPLIIHGARQVGKTWIMKEFGRTHFDDYIYINFDNNERMRNVFELDYDIKRIVSAIKIETGKGFNPTNTLLIFDEIQEVPKAMSALKYFCEDAPDYYVIAAGSLLGMSLHEGTSFPVGKVDFLNMHPLSFKEFLMAVGEAALAELLDEKDYEFTNAYHAKYIDLLKHYYFIGGMPEAVKTYIETDDLSEVRTVQKNLLLYYESDFSKHAPLEQIPRIQMVWNSIPAQLAKENRKFIYGIVREGARAKDFELSIQWLKDYGLIYQNIRIKKPDLPLISYIEQSAFKLFMLDIGLLAAKTDLSARTILDGSRIFEEFKGALTEQYVAQQLVANEFPLYYYSAENSRCEIDFIIQKDDVITPIEVKAEENLKAQSLKVFCEKYHIGNALRTSMSLYRVQSWMTNVPLYCIAEHLKTLT